MTQTVPAFAAGWLLLAALLTIEHLLWKNTPRVVRYLLGGGALCASCTLAGILLDNPALAIGPWAIGSAGLIIVAWTVHEDRVKAQERALQKRGEIIGAAKGLVQEFGDARQSDPGHGRQN